MSKYMICQMVNMLGLLFGDVLAKMIVTSQFDLKY